MHAHMKSFITVIKIAYLCVKNRHNSVFGFPHILPLPAHLDVWICRGEEKKGVTLKAGEEECVLNV